jgi:biopolymer transport protein ExbD
VALTIQADSSIFIDKDPVQLEVLTEMLVARAEQEKLKAPDKEPSIQIFADDMLTYGELFKVLDAVKLAKIRKISLQAKPK